MIAVLRSMLREDRAQGMVQYALVTTLIAVFVIASLTLLRSQLQIVFYRIRSGLMSS